MTDAHNLGNNKKDSTGNGSPEEQIDRVRDELLSTEEAYLSGLTILVDVCISTYRMKELLGFNYALFNDFFS